MKIGDRIYVRGYIDEIRKDTVIVRNDGGYFGTIPSEVTGELPSAQSEHLVKESGNLVNGLVNDCISRQAAIDEIKEDKIDLTDPNVVAVFKATGDFEKVETQVMTCDRHIKILKDLPSAQPEIIRCKDCKNWDTTWTNDFSPNYHYCPMVDGGRKGDWYCADAERRADE